MYLLLYDFKLFSLFHLDSNQGRNLALEAGLEPAADFRQEINSLPPATNSGTLE